jgi:MFS family permease
LRLTENRKPKFFYGYIIVLAIFFIMAISHGAMCSFGVFFKRLLFEFGWSRATISGASSLCAFLMGFLGIITGGLADRFGPRIVLTICGFFFGLGYLLMSQINSIWQLYLFYGVIVGIGISASDVPLLSATARWFVKRRGMMSGIVKAGTGTGMLVMPIVVSRLISTYDWRTTCIVLGIIGLVIIMSAAQFLRRDPGQMGQLPDGEDKPNIVSLNSSDGGFSLREAIHLRQFWTMCVIYFLVVFCVHAVVVHIAPHAEDLGISVTNAASMISIIGGASIVGRLVMGSASDRIGSKASLIICLVILLAAFLWLQLAKELWMLYLFVAIYGIAHGGFLALASPVVAELFGTVSHGVILGIVLFSGAVGGAIGPILTGRVFDITGSYQPAFLACATISVVGIILTSLMKPVGSQGRLSTRS